MPDPTTPSKMSRHMVLTVEEMYRADALAIEAGISGLELMESAGRAVSDTVLARWPDKPISVLCGPGNNGGDGFVAARHLASAGINVELYLLGNFENLKGDAAHHAAAWQQETNSRPRPLADIPVNHASVIVDAVFGAGLSRPIQGEIAALLQRVTNDAGGVLAVDMPSGVDGDTGAVPGYAPMADITLTFFRKKPAHVLYPGRDHMGEIIVADIGIPCAVLKTISPLLAENDPALWGDRFPELKFDSHKYTRGHLIVVGGETMTGAARLAARAARRMGAGLATIITAPSAFDIYAKGDPGTIVEAVETLEAFESALADTRRNAIVLGPGAGVSQQTREQTLIALGAGKALVLDADGISCFQDEPSTLFRAINGPVVITPHEGEFSRLFPITGDRVSRARKAAETSGAVILLKGPDTIIASPDGRMRVNTNAPPELATAGSGDVLSGIIGGLLAQGMPAFDAAAAGAWIHGRCGGLVGIGMIAEDICDALPQALREIGDFRQGF